jgi:hypothetical protein
MHAELGHARASYTKYYISTRLHVSSREASDLIGFVSYCYVCHFLLRAVLSTVCTWMGRGTVQYCIVGKLRTRPRASSLRVTGAARRVIGA